MAPFPPKNGKRHKIETAPRVPDDVNEPVYQEFLAIPSTGTGLDLTYRQLCILIRRSPAERNARASAIFSRGSKSVKNPGGIIYYRMRDHDLLAHLTESEIKDV
ncbi:hypothetical protein ONS96_008410 [Cadophora gregata f. sp. sojae]|nr:hypothetical protein ONS96_008410 [Cadophora gregata f. sp. sojae]